jgi:Transposase
LWLAFLAFGVSVGVRSVGCLRFPRFAGWAVIKERTAMNRNRSSRRYDREFRNNAVALVRGGHTIIEVALDLGVSKWPPG